MTGSGNARRRRSVAVLGTAVAILSVAVLSPATAVSPAQAQEQASPVTVSVLSIDPTTPAVTTTAAPLTVTVSLLNTTTTTLSGVSVAAERGEPIGTQAALDASLANPAARTGGKAIAPVKSAKVTLAPGVAVTTTFRTTTSRIDDRLCLCIPAGVYPLDLTARATVDGSTEVLGGTRTYLPSFDVAPAHKLGVTWVWPLVDRPHRLADGRVFTDDDLATSVAPGGRLSRALQVVQQVVADTAQRASAPIPMTLVTDPDLIDELQVMATTAYTVRSANGTTAPGTGQQAAANWLATLRSVLVAQPEMDLEFTPLGDPDVTGLSRHDETWTSGLSTAIANRVGTALGGARVPTHTFAWPPTGSATVDTLDSLVTGGVDTVLLDSARVRPSTSGGIPVSAARLKTSGVPVNALLTSPALQRYAQSALAGSTAALPELSSELAVRVAQRPAAIQYAVLAAPRYVDATPTIAARAVEETSNSTFSEPVSADTVAQGIPAGAGASSVRRPVDTSTGLSDSLLDSIQATTDHLRPVNALFGGSRGSTAGRAMLATLPNAVQRSESAAWSTAGAAAGVGGGPEGGRARTAALTAQLSGYLGQVRILNRSLSSYTLASNNSPLPVTVVNDSLYTASVIVSVNATGNLPGFPRRETAVVQVSPRSKTTFSIRTNIQRPGRIPVDARLRTTDNYNLGTVKLFVHSTVLGTIGVVITVVAGVVLALALLVRLGRRLLRLRRRRQRAAA